MSDTDQNPAGQNEQKRNEARIREISAKATANAAERRHRRHFDALGRNRAARRGRLRPGWRIDHHARQVAGARDPCVRHPGAGQDRTLRQPATRTASPPVQTRSRAGTSPPTPTRSRTTPDDRCTMPLAAELRLVRPVDSSQSAAQLRPAHARSSQQRADRRVHRTCLKRTWPIAGVAVHACRVDRVLSDGRRPVPPHSARLSIAASVAAILSSSPASGAPAPASCVAPGRAGTTSRASARRAARASRALASITLTSRAGAASRPLTRAAHEQPRARELRPRARAQGQRCHRHPVFHAV